MSMVIDTSNIIYSYIPVAIILIVALLMPPMTMTLVKLLSPRNKSPAKYDTFESGSEPIGDARIQFNVEYYLYGIAFVLFDIEVLFLYPWATIFKQPNIMTTATVEMLIFIFVVLFGYLYLIKKGALKWQK
jgi:F420H2 dehydrogenase subunit A